MKQEVEAVGAELEIAVNPEKLTIEADEDLLEMVLINLLKNFMAYLVKKQIISLF